MLIFTKLGPLKQQYMFVTGNNYKKMYDGWINNAQGGNKTGVEYIDCVEENLGI